MNTKRRRNLLLMTFVLLLAGAALAAYTPHARSVSDSWFYLCFLHDDASTYAPGFSEGAFNRVRIGMSEAEVVSMLGEPLRKNGEGQRYWRYSAAPPDRNYFLRVIVFDSGKVIEKDGHYFVD